MGVGGNSCSLVGVYGADMETMTPQTLLLSPRVREITYTPFVSFVVDNYLPPELYEALRASFPGERYFVKEANDEKHSHKRCFSTKDTPEVLQEFASQHALWGQFLDTLSSKAFTDDLHALVQCGLVQSRGIRVYRRWWHVTPSFEFSKLAVGSQILPHTDAASKLVSLILYFPPQDWHPSFAGGTGFYLSTTKRQERNWGNRPVPFSHLELVRYVEYIPNRLIVFLKSSNSYHGVPILTCPAGFQRNTLNFSYNVPELSVLWFARRVRDKCVRLWRER